MLFLALSCLQGRPQWAAALELLALEPDGLQLTPGNAPDEEPQERLCAAGVPFSTHHGFTTTALRRRVWGPGAALCVDSRSVHPPAARESAPDVWRQQVERGAYPDILFEVMYPGYPLGTGQELTWALDVGLRLAVDISHLHLQRSAGVLDGGVERRLLSSPLVEEVHVSANDGRRDQHRPLTANTSGLAWARERLQGGTPTVLECYMHRLTTTERQRQLAILRGEA